MKRLATLILVIAVIALAAWDNNANPIKRLNTVSTSMR